MSVYTPGSHTVTITGSLADISDTTYLFLTFANPCGVTDYNWIRALKPGSIENVYPQVLGESELTLTFNESELYEQAFEAPDCGPIYFDITVDCYTTATSILPIT